MAAPFGFVQFDFAGTLPLTDGRYLARDEGGRESVLVVATTGAPRPPGRRRRRARAVEPAEEPSPLSLTRVTAIRAFAPFADPGEAHRWLEQACEAEDTADVLVGEAIDLLNRALHVRAVAAADPHAHQLTPERAAAVRIGYGSGEEVAAGEFSEARSIDVRASGASWRRRRQEDLQPQQRVAAVLGGRERVDVCETLLLRARADLDGGRHREAALQLRVGTEALLAELAGAVSDPGHDRDMAQIAERQDELAGVSTAALTGDPTPEQVETLGDLLAICERVLRRRRVLGA